MNGVDEDTFNLEGHIPAGLYDTEIAVPELV